MPPTTRPYFPRGASAKSASKVLAKKDKKDKKKMKKKKKKNRKSDDLN